MWDVEGTDEFDGWYHSLSEEDQDRLIARIELLEQRGPGLGRPDSRQCAPIETPKYEGTSFSRRRRGSSSPSIRGERPSS